MLSRVANCVYWMCRYVERAENVARFIDVTRNLALDSTVDLRPQWEPLVYTSGDQGAFLEKYGAFDTESVVQFLTCDRDNPNSIFSCIASARENARIIRDTISSEMWEVLNSLYLTLRDDMLRDSHRCTETSEAFDAVKRGSQSFLGVMDSTLSHGESWHFARMGTFMERADKTSRILDVKYYLLLPSLSEIGSPLDNIHWSALLGSASGLEMYRKRYGLVTPTNVVAFLLLDPEFPRSVLFCLGEVEDALRAVSHSPAGQWSFDAEKLLARVRSDLSFSTADEIIGGGLHENIDDLQTKFNAIDAGILQHYFQVSS